VHKKRAPVNRDGRQPVYSMRKKVGFFGGLLVFVVLLILPAPSSMPPLAQRTAAVAALMAIWWITETISISATALLPIALFPLLGIKNVRETTAAFGDSNIYLFFGGFLMAAALEKCKLHLRIAYVIITTIGRTPRQIILGFMVAAAFLSMWISNTATTLMMLPIGIAAALAITDIEDIDHKTARFFGTALMLGIAYSASVGGIGTIIGTPPNIIFAASAESLYPDLNEIGFLQWMTFGIPVTVILLPVIWLLLTRVIFRITGETIASARAALVQKRRALGSMKYDEKATLFVFVATAAGWIFRKDIILGSVVIPGWSGLFPHPEYINDATVAIAAALVLFCFPTDRKFRSFLLTWREARGIPWGILILFGGGIALASGFTSSGLSEWFAHNLKSLQGIPPWLFIFVVAIIVTFLTEITSNTATATIFMPIMGGLASGIGYHPYLLMLPAAISASCAFMLPVATPPNAIVFGSGKVSIMDMVRTGIILNIVGAAAITVIVYFIAAPLLNL